MSDSPREIKVNFPEGLQAGVYANGMLVSHTRDEFVMDFSFLAPPAGTVTARVITSPGHVKRIIAALQENVRKYESTFGTIIQAESPRGSIKYHA